jgi:predicted aminopeptidase
LVKKRNICISLLLILVVFSTGCRLTYIFHAARGQIRLLNGSVPVEEALEGETLTLSQKDRLALVSGIKDFGEREFALKKTKNYETIYMGGPQHTIYVVSAAPKDRLSLVTWWFPVVGHVPYLGFFDLEKAKKERKKLLEKDLDVIIGIADAYSTLGWLKDPITLNMMDGSIKDLVEIILHEMTHTTLYVKGQGEFNEGLAVLVGKYGALLFLQNMYGPTHPLTVEARRSIKDERMFCSFINTLFTRLEDLYQSPLDYPMKLEKREKIFSESRERFDHLKTEFKTNQFLRFGENGLNNAYLMSVGLYHRQFNFFESVFKKNGNSIKKTLIFFQALAKKNGDILDSAKQEIKETGYVKEKMAWHFMERSAENTMSHKISNFIGTAIHGKVVKGLS